MSDELPSLSKWIADHTGLVQSEFQLVPLAGDASFRRYFRLSLNAKNYIAVHAPPATENNASFLRVHALLHENCIRVPEIQANNLDFGYLLLEDLGDMHLYDCLSDYKSFAKALDLLLDFALVDITDIDLPLYSSVILKSELDIFPEWFLTRLLGLKLGLDEKDLIEEVFKYLIIIAQEQPKIFIHRDFHSRNIMCLKDGNCAVIDFQDAVIGPITYDFVSLVKDCYVCRSSLQTANFALQFKEKLIQRNLLSTEVGDLKFLQWADLMGLQRHLKVLGVFSRLCLRDGKPVYLSHLPLVIDYVVETIYRYEDSDPIMSEFKNWFEHSVLPVISFQQWMESP